MVGPHVSVWVHIPEHVCGGQSLFSLFTMWVLGSKLKLSGLVVGVFAP